MCETKRGAPAPREAVGAADLEQAWRFVPEILLRAAIGIGGLAVEIALDVGELE